MDSVSPPPPDESSERRPRHWQRKLAALRRDMEMQANLPDSTSEVRSADHSAQEQPSTSLQSAQLTKSGLQRLLDFLEQPLFLTVVSIIGGIVGALLSTPVFIVCDACILLALHRSSAISHFGRKAQTFVYLAIGVVVGAALLWIGALIQERAKSFVSDIASAVVALGSTVARTPSASQEMKADALIATESIYSDAVGKLRSDNEEVRIAAIYQLEQIASRDGSKREAIASILTKSLKEMAVASIPRNAPHPLKETIPKMKDAVQLILTVLGRHGRQGSSLDLGAIHLPQVDLRNGHFEYAFFAGSFLNGTLQNASFDNADFRTADLTLARLDGAHLDGIDLTGGSMYATQAKNVTFRGAILVGACFVGANLRGADFTDAKISATFRGADLKGAIFKNADLSITVRTPIDPNSGIDLVFNNPERKTSFLETNMEGVNLSGADLRGVDLRGTVGLTAQQIRAARVDDSTILPAALGKIP